MPHQVRTHKRTVNGKTVTVRRHQAEDPEAAQRKRDLFERRVLRERQETAHPDAYPARRTPGERKRRTRGRGKARAKRHARKALRLWRRHKVKALLFAGLAAVEFGSWAAMTAVRKMRQRRKKGRNR